MVGRGSAGVRGERTRQERMEIREQFHAALRGHGFGKGDRNRQQSIGAQTRFVACAIQPHQMIIQFALGAKSQSLQAVLDFLLDMRNGGQATETPVSPGITVAQFPRFVPSCGGTGRHRSLPQCP